MMKAYVSCGRVSQAFLTIKIGSGVDRRDKRVSALVEKYFNMIEPVLFELLSAQTHNRSL
jgi:hypothetical protein